MDERVSLYGIAKGLCAADGDDSVNWVDMGGGRGLALRQLAAKIGSERLATTNVDLFDIDVAGLNPKERADLEKDIPGTTSEAATPRFIRADIQTVTLPEPANFITSVESIQYLSNPLAAVSNWYNQLATDGLLIISADHEWSDWIRYRRDSGEGDNSQIPTRHLLETLDTAGIPYAATLDVDYKSGYRPALNPRKFCTLAIQKALGTHMTVNAEVADVWVNHEAYKAVYYDEPAPGSPPIVEVVPAY